METLNDVSSYKLYDSIDFENLTGRFWIKKYIKINYNSKKKLSLKADGIKFQCKNRRKEMSSTRLRKLRKALFKCL